MISSMLISEMIDEDKSKENVSAFPMQSVINQSDAYHMNQSLANHSSVNINTAFILLPRRLGIQISSDDNKVQPDSYSKEEKECHNQKKGFASITITARRVIPPCKNKMQGNVSSSSCLKCQGSKLLTNIVSPSNVTGLDQLYGPLHVQGCCQNPNATEKRVSKPCPQLCKGKSYGITSPENRENRLVPPGNNLNKEAQISFTSSVHLSISQQCPNTIYYVDKSLLVPVDQPQTKNQKIHRSVVSFNINCSSPTLTPDGVDGLANGKLITDVLKTKLPEDSKTPLKAIWNAYLKENNWVKKQTLETDSLGTEYLWKGTSPSETLSVVDSPQGLDNLSSHFASPPLLIDTQAFSGSSRKQCTRNTYHETIPASFLQQPSKKVFMVEGRISSKDKHRPKNTSEAKESQAQCFPKPAKCISDCGCIFSVLKCNLTKTVNGKLEALEVHKPHFISRSQERMKKLEHMVQMRKAQQGDASGKKPEAVLSHKLSSSSITSKKKQFTVPHPLSDNLFKPKERYISEKEMHMRSKRIYNNLPEVRKKQEEKQKRVILQSNRMRVEVFKKVMILQ
uniref:Chromosome 10 open reading frame 90 n=1 Tax=Varanus komodoensis TaxID=61221 RepID=A0A8D2J8U4_VARKO